MKHLIIFALGMLTQKATASDDATESPWKGKAELGVVNSNGNTNTSSSNGKFNLVYDAEKWKQEFRVETYKAESEVEENGVDVMKKTADRTYFFSKTDYKFSQKSYAYVLLDYADENFTSYDYIGNFSLGFGRSFIKDKETELEGEIGYGLRRYQEKHEIIAEEEEVARLAGAFKQKVSDNANFQQEIVAEFGKDFDVYKSITALTVNINSSMALSVGYEVQHTTEVDEGFEKTDSKTTVNLVYNFL